MHGLSAAALCHLHSPDIAISPLPPFPSLPNFSLSHYSPSPLSAYCQLLRCQLDSVPESEGLLNSEVSYSGSSGPCSSNGSPTSQPGLIQRSLSSHGLDLQLSALGPVRRVHSAGDLQGRAERGWSSESSLIIEGMAKACRYSPEEKRERIERYKTKRNQRNFNKKIKYECRKTLADSRRRIRGRFARNEETEHKNFTTSPVESWSYATGEDDGSWISFLDSCSVNLVP
ncbi:uncharacterized protein LOC111023585 [Momordica charantia]|uniref:Uncharacterized protein LOC111023585 n=1 Tax=Momordica charantia TaxID=3673 RepID=A0A6J1DVX1_MOMCH|nr:uncharacterized protein LOC111023585 [Momordica charantia]